MFERTDHHLAPWDIVSGEQKRHARVAVLETLIERVEQGIERWGRKVPDAARPLSHARDRVRIAHLAASG